MKFYENFTKVVLNSSVCPCFWHISIVHCCWSCGW